MVLLTALRIQMLFTQGYLVPEFIEISQGGVAQNEDF